MFRFETLRTWTIRAGVVIAIPLITSVNVRCQTPQQPTSKWQKLVVHALDLERGGHIAAAETALTSALDFAVSAPDADLAVPVTLNNLATLYQDTGRTHDAERAYVQAIRRLEATYGPNTGMLATPLCGLITLHLDNGDTAKARRHTRRLEGLVNSPEVGPVEQVRIHTVQARVLHVTGKLAEAAPEYVRALSIAESSPEVQPTGLASVLNNVGAFELDRGNFETAHEYLDRAEKTFEEMHGPNTPLLISPLVNLAAADWVLKDFRSSEQRLERALSIAQRVYGGQSTQMAQILTKYATVLRAAGRKHEARLASSRARAIAQLREKEPGRYTVDVESLRSRR